LIAALEDDSFQARERATHELEAAGPDALPALRAARSNNPSPEKKRRLEALLEQRSQGFDRRRLRCQRVFEVLERIGSPPARKLFRELAATPLSAELTEETRASLRRMGEKP
jgi:hypothetical protein